jgi:hypothetical protein
MIMDKSLVPTLHIDSRQGFPVPPLLNPQHSKNRKMTTTQERITAGDIITFKIPQEGTTVPQALEKWFARLNNAETRFKFEIKPELYGGNGSIYSAIPNWPITTSSLKENSFSNLKRLFRGADDPSPLTQVDKFSFTISCTYCDPTTGYKHTASLTAWVCPDLSITVQFFMNQKGKWAMELARLMRVAESPSPTIQASSSRKTPLRSGTTQRGPLRPTGQGR